MLPKNIPWFFFVEMKKFLINKHKAMKNFW